MINIKKETFEVKEELLVLYDTLRSISEFFNYPDDIKKKIADLLNYLDLSLYRDFDGYVEKEQKLFKETYYKKDIVK